MNPNARWTVWTGAALVLTALAIYRIGFFIPAANGVGTSGFQTMLLILGGAGLVAIGYGAGLSRSA